MRTAIGQFLKTATWPPGPDIRGRDLIWIGLAGVIGAGVVVGASAVIAWLAAETGEPASSIEFGMQPDPTGDQFWPRNLAIAASYAYFALIVQFILIRPKRQTWRSLGFKGFEWKWLAVAAAAGSALFFVGEWTSGLFEIGDEADTYNRSQFFVDGATALTIPVEIALIGPATAMIEEVLFRGLLHRWIRQRLGMAAGIAISAVIFSLVHFSFADPGGVLGWYWATEIVAIGVILALLFEWSGSLWPPILLHATNNVAAVALAHMAV